MLFPYKALPKALFQGGHSFFIDGSKPTQFKQFPKRQKILFKPFELGLILNLLQLKYLLHIFLINYVIFKKWKSSFQHHHLKWKNCKSSNRKLGNICSVCNSSSVQQFFFPGTDVFRFASWWNYCSYSAVSLKTGILWLQMTVLFNHEKTRLWIRESISKRKVTKNSGIWLHNSNSFHFLNENGMLLQLCIRALGVHSTYAEVQWRTFFQSWMKISFVDKKTGKYALWAFHKH